MASYPAGRWPEALRIVCRITILFSGFFPLNPISKEVCSMASHEEWSRAMRAIWLLNTIEVELSHLGIPLMRVPPALRDLGDTLLNMDERDRLRVEDELSRAHAS